ncbi:UvrD-helicase domain-containing protein [Mycolicibacterium insubricum]|uniref:UvrD-helicase domain-containing protein n=1 Tax=Mycolicibacterium insubricum TaxID=444597 RepID=UPI0021F351D6|nr:UvrD-helicase domain-containing protein [Mycolicibacterium insubricum]MCV7083866.1 UvrD-helicase domain-containing protein [Mycolicibacterium insubricum]
MQPFNLLDPLPAPGTTLLLEASAGTGKTYALAAMVTRYIAEGAVTLDQMLLITFTRAATRELRERVRGQLLAAAEAFEDPETATGDLLPALLDVDAQEFAARRKRLRDALADFDDASVTTTHGFCQIVLKSLGIAGDSESGVTLVDNLDDLADEITDDLYLAGFAQSADQPTLTRAEAGKLARHVIANPGVELQPVAPQPGTEAALRRAFAGRVLAELEIRKRRSGILSYDDLLSRLATALADPQAPAREQMRRRWKVVMVDEFQDTDPIQWQILHRAFDGHSTLILIGDPKQAIYAFRGADVNTYLQAAATAGIQRTLDTNWRSDARLVDALAILTGGAALGDPAIVVHPVKASHDGGRLVYPSGESAPPIRLRTADRARFRVRDRKTIRIDWLREHITADLVADIGRMLADGTRFDGEPLTAGDIAVLTESNFDARRCHEALLAAGIPAVYTGEIDVFDSEAADDWLILLEAFDAPHRSGLVRAAAATMFFGHTANTLAEGGPALTDRIAETLREWAGHARDRGIAAVLEAALLDGMGQRVLGCVGGERRMTDLTQLAQLLGDAAHRNRLSPSGLHGWLTEQRRDRGGASERRRRLDSDAQAVSVLTVWASKGLQFPVVYLPFAFNRHLHTDDYPRYHDDAGRRCLYIGGDGGRERRDADGIGRRESAGESLRVNYVALTRAQSQVVAWWAPARDEPTGALSRLLRGRTPGGPEVPDECDPVDTDDAARTILDDWQRRGAITVEDAEIAAIPTPVEQPPATGQSVRRFTRGLDSGWRRTSYSGLLRAAEGMVVATGVGSEPVDVGKDDEPGPSVISPGGSASVGGGGASVASAGGPGVKPGPSVISPGAPEEIAVPGGTADAPVSPMADLAAGAAFGSLVHAVLESADPQAPDLAAELTEQVRAHQLWWPCDIDASDLAEALVPMHDTPLGPLADGLTLRQIGRRDRLRELDFEIPLAGGDSITGSSPQITVAQFGQVIADALAPDDPLAGYAARLQTPELGGQPLRGYLSGSIDAVLRVPGPRYLIVDYKTNRLGDPSRPLTAADYGPRQLVDAMEHSHYPLQALLYSVVLHRFLRWRQPGYRPEQHLGGVLYLFLRGMCGPDTPAVDGVPAGVFSWRPPARLIEDLSDLLAASEADGRVSR